MQYSHRAITGLTVPVGLSLVLALASPASAQQHYERVNLVSDIDGVALRTDPHLVNPWGIAFSPNGPFWVSDNGTGSATLYNGAGQLQSLVVTIPPSSGSSSGTDTPPTGTPTGQVFNSFSKNFAIPPTGSPSVFLFATEDGTISGWNPIVNGTQAIPIVTNKGAVYKGLAIGISNKYGPSLYATNFHDGIIEQYDSSFNLVGTFKDKDLYPDDCDSTKRACFAPFGIQNINGLLYVTYAQQDDKKHDDVAGLGNGFIDILNPNGNGTLKRFTSKRELNSPWGLALAPQNFGQFSRALLVGNFGDGHINAFDPGSHKFLGQLHDQIGQTLAINGLWALVFGNGQKAGARNSLFFTAGIGDEGHGLFGVIHAREDQNKNDEHQDEYGESPDVMNY